MILSSILFQACCVICIGLVDDPASHDRTRMFMSQRTIELCYATFASFLILSAVFLIGKAVRDE